MNKSKRPTKPAASFRVPIESAGIYAHLASTASQFIGHFKPQAGLMLSDEETALSIPDSILKSSSVAAMLILDGRGVFTRAYAGVDQIEAPPPWNDRPCLIFRSSTLSLAVVAPQPQSTGEAAAGFWSTHPATVDGLLAELLPDRDPASLFPEASTEPMANIHALNCLMSQAQHDSIFEFSLNAAQDKDDLASVLNILKAISAKRRTHDILFVFVEQIASIVKSDRCSVVRIWSNNQYGSVLASHEDETINDRDIELAKYPELNHAMSTREKVAINGENSRNAAPAIVAALKSVGIDALLVIPIVLFDANVGSLFLRALRKKGHFTLREISFLEIVAEAASNALERAHLFESIQIANQRLERLAITDGLTGLYNYRHFKEAIESEFVRAKRYAVPLSILILDIDNFKSFNDTYGHLVGDSVLRELAERSAHLVRKSDLIARYGGEEFAVILPQTGVAGALVEGERIREMVSGRPFRDVPAKVTVTVSIGVGILDHAVMQSVDELIKAADNALYEAKRQGKNRVICQTT
ncbi:MAG: sensor domain-containing diguanylate cyclase [Candidatus Hydrogenedentes bacterium]|nr:sensor domain-containing diguanylate cyclase [Candidatus Hydrogenedentota bacterium]